MSRARSLLLAATLALAVLPAASPTFAQSPSPATGPDPIALVRATDPRFADLPTFTEVRRELARTFDWTPLLAGSWISLVSTSGAVAQDLGGDMGWLDPGVGWIVEVMLVDGCPAKVEAVPLPADPCVSRESRLFLVGQDGTVSPLAEASSPAAP